MRRAIPTIIILAVTVFTATAALAALPRWNHGYNGWPGGFGYPPRTVHAQGYPCSVTVYGPTFKLARKHWSQYYGGGTSCRNGVGQKTLTVSEQVLGRDGHTWHTVSGSTFVTDPTFANPVRQIEKRAGVLGHFYRAVATARLVVPNGHAGCSLSNTCDQTITVRAVSRKLARGVGSFPP